MTVKLLTEQNLEFLSLTGGCTGSSETTLVKMPHCWKSRAKAHLLFVQYYPESHGDDRRTDRRTDKADDQEEEESDSDDEELGGDVSTYERIVSEIQRTIRQSYKENKQGTLMFQSLALLQIRSKVTSNHPNASAACKQSILPLKRQEKMYLKMSSAEVVCCK